MHFADFIYKPEKLEEAVREISSKHTGIGRKSELIDEKERLKQILEKIRAVGIGELRTIALELNTCDLYIICSHIASGNPSAGNTQNKLLQILRWRYRKGFLKFFWEAVQRHPNTMGIIAFFRELLSKAENPTKILGISDLNIQEFRNWVSSDHLINKAISLIQNLNIDYKVFMDRYSIRMESALATEILIELLSTCGKALFNSIDKYYLKEKLDSWTVQSQSRVLNNYLLKHEINEFAEVILSFIQRKYDNPGNPRQKYFWDEMSEMAKRKYKQWYYSKLMDMFFSDRERLYYWKRKIPLMIDLKYIRHHQQLFMYFGSVVAIEFGEVGNAAYFYKTPYFEKYFARFASDDNCVPNSELKVKIDNNFIIHMPPNWQYRMDYKLREFGIR
jgi:hypothetical protein